MIPTIITVSPTQIGHVTEQMPSGIDIKVGNILRLQADPDGVGARLLYNDDKGQNKVIKTTEEMGAIVALANSATLKVDTVTLTGTSGTANITMDAVDYLATFDTDLTTTAANFVTLHKATFRALGVLLSSSGSDVIFTSDAPGNAFSSPTIANVTGDLDGTVANTVADAAGTLRMIMVTVDYIGTQRIGGEIMHIAIDNVVQAVANTKSGVSSYQSTINTNLEIPSGASEILYDMISSPALEKMFVQESLATLLTDLNDSGTYFEQITVAQVDRGDVLSNTFSMILNLALVEKKYTFDGDVYRHINMKSAKPKIYRT